MTKDFTIQRCPHDEENPYAQISNNLIRDTSISPNCRMIIIFLLSNKNNWSIRMSHLYNEFKEYLGRDLLYSLVNEAIKAGYMLRHEFREGNLKRYKYFLSERPKFKKCLRYPENQYAENKENITEIKCPHKDYSQFPDPQYPENQGRKERTIKEITNNNNKAAAPVAVPSFIQELDRLTEKDKLFLAKCDPDRVKAAIEYSKTAKIKTTLIRLLRWHIEFTEIIPPEEKKYTPEDNKKLAKVICKKYESKNYKILVLNKIVEFEPPSGQPLVLSYEDKEFVEKIKKILKDKGFKEKL